MRKIALREEVDIVIFVRKIITIRVTVISKIRKETGRKKFPFILRVMV